MALIIVWFELGEAPGRADEAKLKFYSLFEYSQLRLMQSLTIFAPAKNDFTISSRTVLSFATKKRPPTPSHLNGKVSRK